MTIPNYIIKENAKKSPQPQKTKRQWVLHFSQKNYFLLLKNERIKSRRQAPATATRI